MGLLDRVLGRRPPVRDLVQLADFIDENAAFLVQKGIYEYSRARAGHYAKVLLVDPGFLAAVEKSRWQAYPLGLAMVGEMVECTLQPHVGDDRPAVLKSLRAVVLSVFDRYSTPDTFGEGTWSLMRDELAHALDLVGLHPPKRVMDIPEPFAKRYFALMPIHEKLRGQDQPTTRNYLRVTMINMHDELTRRMDAGEMVALLRSLPA